MSTQAFSIDAPRPIEPPRRIPDLDIIRGVAVVGLLFANMPFYSAPTYHTGLMATMTSLNGLAVLAVQFFFQGKVYALFAFLFGQGIAMQLARLDAGGMSRGVIVRRLLALAVIGVLHVTLLWYGDILVYYSVLGLLLLLMWRWPSKLLLSLAVFCLAFPVMFGLVKISAHFPTPRTAQSTAAGAPQADRTSEAAQQASQQAAQDSVRIYATGSVREVAVQRWHDVQIRVVPAATALPHFFAMLLFGLYVGRRGIARDLEAHLPWIRRVFWWCLAAGLVMNAISVGLRLVARPQVMPPWILLPAQATFYFGAPAFAFAYASGIVLLLERGGRAARWLRLLAPAGRMAVTNYLLQSVICTTLFYGYGFGLYGKVDAVSMLGLSALIVGGEVVLSHVWLRRFTFGPVEWLWRFATYGRAPAIVRSVVVST
jgi:uncharacterized protein